jgi:hypothetical protein
MVGFFFLEGLEFSILEMMLLLLLFWGGLSFG